MEYEQASHMLDSAALKTCGQGSHSTHSTSISQALVLHLVL